MPACTVTEKRALPDHSPLKHDRASSARAVRSVVYLLRRAAVLIMALASTAPGVAAVPVGTMLVSPAGEGGGLPPLVRIASTTGAVAVTGNRLLRDGQPWVPHGVVSIAFVAPPAAQKGIYARAYRQFDRDVLIAMQVWGADTVRFQVSQPGLDPRNPLFTTSFVQEVRNAVLGARAIGLNVIVSVQDEPQSGETAPADLPNDATRRVWRVLAPLFNADQGILYEMLNEPRLPVSPTNWSAWQTAMNQTIAAIRQTGSRNVVVADGLMFAARLDGAPLLTDPVRAVAYGSHPYAHASQGQTQAVWDKTFGLFSRKFPVIVTEWTTIPSYFCDTNTPAAAAAFLRYLDAHGIGLTAFAFDFARDGAGSIVHGFDGTPSSFTGLRCGDAGFGPGQLVQQLFRAHAGP